MLTKTTTIALYDNDSTWMSRLQFAVKPIEVWICTYSIPRGDSAVPKLIDARGGVNTVLVANPTANKVIERAYHLKQQYASMRIILHPKVHAKMVLAGGYSFISTENFGSNASWFERTIGIHDQEIYNKNLNDLKQFLRNDPGIEVELNQPISVYYNKFQVLYPH